MAEDKENGQQIKRTFTDSDAVRDRVPLLIGFVGPSGGGKTMSALRVATGIQRVTGGDIYMLDTESRRGLHYADKFKFKHVPFVAPFSPLDYLAGIEHCAKRGASVVIVDSMSHEHEGPGGVLEMHEAEVQRLSKGDPARAAAVNFLAWSKPKQMRRRLINTVMQLPVTLIACFRAKDKLKIVKGKDPVPLGWMPIAGEEFIYEMTVNCLLPPAADGVPDWDPKEPGEKQMIKLPEQFRGLLGVKAALSEDIGEAMAKWAESAGSPFGSLATMIASAPDETALEALGERVKAANINGAERSALVAGFRSRREALTKGNGHGAESSAA